MPALEPGPDGLRASDLLGVKAYDAGGRYLGRVADLIAEDGDDPSVVAAVVTRPPWGRLLGYERESATGPKLLELFARAVLRRNSQRVAWPDLHLAGRGAAGGRRGQ